MAHAQYRNVASGLHVQRAATKHVGADTLVSSSATSFTFCSGTSFTVRVNWEATARLEPRGGFPVRLRALRCCSNTPASDPRCAPVGPILLPTPSEHGSCPRYGLALSAQGVSPLLLPGTPNAADAHRSSSRCASIRWPGSSSPGLHAAASGCAPGEKRPARPDDLRRAGRATPWPAPNSRETAPPCLASEDDESRSSTGECLA